MSQFQFQLGQGMFTALTTGFQVLSVTASATGLAYPTGVVRAMATIEGTSGRYCYDGSTPTITAGHAFNSGDVIQVLGLPNIQNFLCIATSAGTVTMMVTYEGAGRLA